MSCLILNLYNNIILQPHSISIYLPIFTLIIIIIVIILATPIIENCSITPPLDVNVVLQQYIVNMITSGVPPTRLVPEIKFNTSEDCGNQDGISCGTPYYLHLSEETYQYSLPINWNATNSEFTHHQFQCEAMFESRQITPLMTAIRGVFIILNIIMHLINTISQLQMTFQL